jgi:hypothetical protein
MTLMPNPGGYESYVSDQLYSSFWQFTDTD